MRPYLGPPWTNSCQIWCVRVFHHVLLKYGHENAEMQKRKFDDVTLWYSMPLQKITHLLLPTYFIMMPAPSIKLCTIATYRLSHSHEQVIISYWLAEVNRSILGQIIPQYLCGLHEFAHSYTCTASGLYSPLDAVFFLIRITLNLNLQNFQNVHNYLYPVSHRITIQSLLSLRW